MGFNECQMKYLEYLENVRVKGEKMIERNAFQTIFVFEFSVFLQYVAFLHQQEQIPKTFKTPGAKS